MHERNHTYLHNILDCISDIEEFSVGFNKESFINDKKTFNACIRMFEVIGEATKRLSEDFKNKHPYVEWKKIAGLRDVLIHDYEGVDLSAVWEIINVNIPELKSKITSIIKD